MVFTSVSDWIKERVGSGSKAASIIISHFGDVVVPHGGAIALGSLVDAGLLAGMNEKTIRSTVNRLIADGWLTSEAQGRRSIYRFSEAGFKRFLSAAPRIYQNANDPWSGEWHIVVVSNQEIEHDQYVRHVHDLMWSGFGKVAENVFIRPKLSDKGVCCNGELDDATSRAVVFFSGRTESCQRKEPIQSMIKRAWDLNTVESRYAAFIERYESLLAAVWKNPRLPGPQAFVIRMFMMHDFRRIRIADPLLPAELLSDTWKGGRAFYIAHELYDLLLPSSEQYVLEKMSGAAGRIPRVDSSFYDRFGGLTRP